MILTLANILVAVLGPLTMWLLASKDPKIARCGWIAALASQPGWFYISIYTQQMGLIVLSCIFLITHIHGFWNTWIKLD